jgi:hypothetical protein
MKRTPKGELKELKMLKVKRRLLKRIVQLKYHQGTEDVHYLMLAIFVDRREVLLVL